jgi:hypothetical protein
VTLEQWISILAIVVSFIVWFLGHRWGSGKKSKEKMLADFMVVAVPVALLVLSIMVFEVDRTKSIKQETELIKENVNRLENSFRNSGSVEVLGNYDDFVNALEREVRKTRSRWLITRVQFTQAPTNKEKAYFDILTNKVKNGDIADCRRIVRIPSREHLARYRQLLTDMRHEPYFAMGVWKAPEPPFNYELLIGDDVVIFAYGQGAPTWALRIPNREAADKFAGTFDELWRRQGAIDIVKDKKSVDDEAEFQEMMKKLEAYAR